MPGSKIPVLEIEKLKITEDGRGIILWNDATNLVVQSATPWTSGAYPYSSTSAKTDKSLLPTASSMGWLKVHYISGSVYGATGATCYIPVFRNLNVNTA